MTDFSEIYTLYAPMVYRVCMGYTNNTDRAKDLVQETFIAVWQNLPGFRSESKMSTWIFRIATNKCLRELQHAKRLTLDELTVDVAMPIEDLKEEKLDLLYRCIGELQETDRIIISLELEGLPQAEIAAIVGISHGNIRIKIHRIKEKLAQKFKSHEQSI